MPAIRVAGRGVPIGERVRHLRRTAVADRIQRRAVQHCALHAATIDLAVVALAEEAAARRVAFGRGADQEAGICGQRRAHAQRFADMRAIVVRHDFRQQAVIAVDHRFLVQRRGTARRIVAHRHEIPDPRDQLHFGRHRIHRGAVADPEFQPAGRIDAEAEAAGAVNRPAAQQHLPASIRQGGKDIGVQRDGPGRRELALSVGNAQKIALLDVLLAHRPVAIDRRGDRLLDEARPVRVLVAMDQANELRAHRVGRIGARHHAERVAGLDRKFVRVGGDADVGHDRCVPLSALRIPSGPARA